MPFTVHKGTPAAFKISHASVHDITDHARGSRKHIPPAGANSAGSRPPLTRPKRACAVYAWADGLNTTLHYRREFHVSLHGEPAITRTGTPFISGDSRPATAISAVIDRMTNLDQHPKSFCDHPGCIYNMGDLITRRTHNPSGT